MRLDKSFSCDFPTIRAEDSLGKVNNLILNIRIERVLVEYNK